MTRKSEMDKEVINALSSDTRTSIIKSLKEKDKTPTVLSKELGKHKSTVVEHLDVLKNSGLVEKEKIQGRKRVLYSLTKKGKQVSSSSPVPIKVILSASLLSLLTGTGFLLGKISEKPPAEKTIGTMAEAGGNASQGNPYFLYLGIILSLLGAIGIFYYWYKGNH